ncbi:heterokaryon incompatibility protein-domain-containing protein [Hypomontagnella submonticulosa]|nr:heterokaryon incompatibility protein-domain-containing protein [Hypomontagnella submonticulosa]
MSEALFKLGASIVKAAFRAKPVVDTGTTHRALSRKQPEIRLLKICPGDDDEPIAVSTLIVPLSWRCPPFIALSYCWGDPTITEEITVNGNPMDATINLAMALRQLRAFHNSPNKKLPYRSADTYLWIDAICINQTDIEEKNFQVPLMADIYSSATHVVIWLGAGNQGTDRFMDWAQSSWKAPTISFTRPEYVLDKPASVDLYWLSLTILLRNWFSRIWIVQEAIRAKKDPLVICGSKTISLAHLAECLRAIATDHGWIRFSPPSPKIKPYLKEHIKDFEDPGDAIQQFLVNRTRLDGLISMRSSPSTRWLYATLEQALLDTMHHEATNTRDKVYGLLGIINEKSRSRVEVDYNLEPWQICLQAIAANCKESGFLVVAISQRHRAKLDLGSSRPSWLPDFTQKPDYFSRLFELPRFWKHWRAPHYVKISPDHRVLTIPGTVIDTVQTRKLLDFDPYDGQKDLQEIESIARTAQAVALSADHPLSSLRRDLDVEIWRVLLLNSSVLLLGKHPEDAKIDTYRSLYKFLVQGNPQDRPRRPTNLDALSDWYWTDEAALAFFAKEMYRLTHNLSFVVTSAGFLGIGPRELESGDTIAILDGTNFLVALRPRSNTDQREHIILGPVFLMGISDRYDALEDLSRRGKLPDEIFDLV